VGNGLKKLFVGNLPFEATEAELQQWFAEASVKIQSVSILHDRFSGYSRGYGFAEVADDSAAELAVKTCNGRVFQGRTLVVNEAVSPADSAPPRTRGGTGRSRRT
jgi:RNA recognition motif-containing protein